MKRLYIIANWKAHKTEKEAVAWLEQFAVLIPQREELEQKGVVLCPSFSLLPIMEQTITEKDMPLAIGAQDFTPFEEGAYTGEDSPRNLSSLVQYAIIGHSERRQYFQESDALLEKKVIQARKHDVTPIYCVQGEETPIPSGVGLVAYEPVGAIGTGAPDTPENADRVAKIIKGKYGVRSVLYGGSVTSENVKQFTDLEHIDGVLVGSASLDVRTFSQIIHNA